jgi:hypothetical protein
MPSRFLPRLNLRHQVAALGVLGIVAGALPLAQLLRYQADEIDQIVAQQAALDPLLQTVTVQRGLLGHRDLAGAVLRGRSDLDAQRGAAALEVDARMQRLDAALSLRGDTRAIDEGAALRRDWDSLAGRIVARAVDATRSDQEHRLLVEQALLITDLLTLHARLADPAARALAHALGRDLPALQQDLARLSDALPAERQAAASRIARAHARLAEAAGTAAQAARGTAATEAARALRQALAHARAQVPAAAVQAPVAAHAVLAATHAALPGLAAQALGSQLDSRAAAVQRQRALAVLALLLWIAAGGAALRQGLSRSGVGQGDGAPSSPAPGARAPASREAAGQLLQRLRQPAPGETGVAGQRDASPAPQDAGAALPPRAD